jgi:hypothetical protein
MKPFFEHFKSMYDPIYSKLDVLGQNTDAYKEGLLPDLIQILEITDHITRENAKGDKPYPYGVYKIQMKGPAGDRVISFFKKTLNALPFSEQTKKEQERDTYYDEKTDEQTTYLEQIQKLPSISIEKNNSTNVKKNSIETTDYFQFFVIGSNLSIRNSSNMKKIFATQNAQKKTSDFFQPNTLYLLYSSRDQSEKDIPSTLFDLDYKTRAITNKVGDIVEKEKTPLERIMWIEWNRYNSAQLALSIFIGLNHLMSS